jgi:hypothetical protein
MHRSALTLPVLLFICIVGSSCAFATEKTDPPKTVAEPVPLPTENEPAAAIVQPPSEPAPVKAPAPVPVVSESPATAPMVKADPVKTSTAPIASSQPAGEVDLIGDKPEATTANAPKSVMEDMQPSEELNDRGRKTYAVLGEIKVAMELISKDLDNNGKEVTRLIKTSDTLAKKITTLADLYNEDENFRDHCATAKRDTLRLNDELSQIPRKWAHVRWAYNDTLTDTRMIRVMARDLAEAEPKPVQKVGKDGKIVYVEQPPKVDPAIAKRDASKANAEAMRAMLRKQEEARKAPAMKTSNDD